MAKYVPINIRKDITVRNNRWIHVLNELETADNLTREELMRSLQTAIETYLDGVNTYIGDYEDVKPNDHLSSTKHSKEISSSKVNNRLLYTEFAGLRSVAINTFNRIGTERQNLLNRLARIAGKIRTLDLYNLSNYRGRYIGESFTSLDTLQIDSANSTLNVDTDSGVVTLPLKEEKKLEVSNIVVDLAHSNGAPGNNMDRSVSYVYSDTRALIDGEPNTWWEYELLKKELNPTDRIDLSLVLTLKENTICNVVRISPLNLGTLSDVEIVSVEGSINGTNWVDLTKDMPLASYRNEVLKDLLTIGSSRSISTNSVALYFNPVLIRQLRIRLSHSEPVRIGPNMFRYAIGIKDIDIHSDRYDDTGSLMTKDRSVEGPVNTFVLFAALSDAAGLYENSFSVNINGDSLVAIQPARSDSLDTNEVIHVLNSDINPSSVGSVGMQFNLSRNNSAFQSINPFEIAPISDRVEAFSVDPTATPIVFSTIDSPKDDNIMVMETPLYRIGGYTILPSDSGGGYDAGTNAFVATPFKVTADKNRRDLIHRDDLVVMINGVPWTRTNDLDAEPYYETVYELKDVSGTYGIKFGNSGGRDARRFSYTETELGGMQLPDGAVVKAYIGPELMNFTYDGNGYRCKLDKPYDGNKNATVIERQSVSIAVTDQVISSNTQQLEPLITSSEVTISEYSTDGTPPATYSFTAGVAKAAGTTTVFQEQVGSIAEVDAAGEFFLDPETGMLHAHSDLDLNKIYVISYEYYSRETLDTHEFSLVRDDDKNEFVGTYIPEANFNATSVEFVLGDSRSDFGSYVTPADSLAGTGDYNNVQFFPSKNDTYTLNDRSIYLSNSNVIRGTLSMDLTPITSDTWTEIEFVDGSSEFIGERGYGSLENLRQYSVDYRRGRIIFPSPLASSWPTTDVNITYQFSQYRISYDVPAYVKGANVNGGTVTLDGEALTAGSNGRIRVFYEFNPQPSVSVDDLAELYTPILRDAQLRYE